MTQGIDTETLCRLAGISRSQLSVWLTRGADLDKPERRGPGLQWDMAQVFGVALFARLVRRNRSTQQAGEDAHGQMVRVGTLITGIATGRHTGATRVVLVDATLADGDRWQRLITSDADLERLMQAMLRRGIRRLEVDDISELYLRVMETFRAQRAEQRQRVLA